MIRIGVRILIAVKILMLADSYLKRHMSTRIFEEEITYEIGGEDVYGIGFDTECGELFWFHRKSEVETQKSYNSKEP